MTPSRVWLLNPGCTHKFHMPDGTIRTLTDPDGPPTARQLARLWRMGALALVEPGQTPAPTKAEAAWAIDWLTPGWQGVEGES